MESKWNETFGRVIFGAEATQETWSRRQGASRKPRGREARPTTLGAPPPSWAPRGSTDLLLPPIYIYVPRKHPGAPRNTISTAVTFCIREISSWNHGGPLHQHPCPSDEL